MDYLSIFILILLIFISIILIITSSIYINKKDLLKNCDCNNDLNFCINNSRNDNNITLKLNKQNEIKKTAKIFCCADNITAKKYFIFNGEKDCNYVKNIFNGEKICKYGCLSMGDCIKICPQNAIKENQNGKIWIDANLCTGCEKCINICPVNIIKMIPDNADFFIPCSSHYKLNTIKNICSVGCTGCQLCDRMIQDCNRIIFDNNLAVIKYINTNTDLIEVSSKCPSKVIISLKNI